MKMVSGKRHDSCSGEAYRTAAVVTQTRHGNLIYSCCFDLITALMSRVRVVMENKVSHGETQHKAGHSWLTQHCQTLPGGWLLVSNSDIRLSMSHIGGHAYAS